MEDKAMEYVTLNNGEKMPKLGIGTYLMPTDDAAKEAVGAALKAGYRLIDTAHAYMIERGVGQAIKESGVDREDIFVTSKLWPAEFGEGESAKAIDKILGRLGLEYIDPLLLHQPFGDVFGAWKDMEKAVAEGKIKSIGISNFEEYRFDELLDAATIKPAVHQVECHPYSQQKEMRKRMEKEQIQLEAWYPIGGKAQGGNLKLFAEPVIVSIASAHRKTPAQIILKWHMQEGFVAIPGSMNPAHISENIDIFDFTLSDREMDDIRAMDKKDRIFKNFEDFTFEEAEKFVLGRKLPD